MVPKTNGPSKKGLKGMRILLCDDSKETHALMNLVFKDSGAYVDSAYDGMKAVEMARDGAYDVILLDIKMPNMDGFLVKDELRKLGVSAPIIAFTDGENGRKFKASSFDDYFPKSDIVACLTDYLSALRT